uniref:RRM domain-containing protein n=1 Tax=Oryza brachyantha TaxID=4533 RepID=J3KUV0_ORYBR
MPMPNVDTVTKLYISNLDYGVSNKDIKELFSEVGDMKRYSINYDWSRRWKGTAEVVFPRRSDALTAVKRYNNVRLMANLRKMSSLEQILSCHHHLLFLASLHQLDTSIFLPKAWFPRKILSNISSAEIFSGPGRGEFGSHGQGHGGGHGQIEGRLVVGRFQLKTWRQVQCGKNANQLDDCHALFALSAFESGN